MIVAGVLEPFVMHRCPVSGQVFGEQVPAGRDVLCSACHQGCLPDQPYRDGHAWIFCPHCFGFVGICGAEAAAALEAETAAALGG